MFDRAGYLQKLLIRRNDGLIKVITGIRRAGKSYLMNELFYHRLISDGFQPDHIIRFAFDLFEDREKIGDTMTDQYGKIKKADPSLFLRYITEVTAGEDAYILLLDEVQELDLFESVLNSLLRRKNLDIYVTGSNSHFLSSDIITEFRGRGEEIHVCPLTFREYTEGLGLSPYDAWRDYLVTGGIPLVAGMKDEEQRASYLKALCSEVYLKDIVNRSQIQDPSDLSELLDVIASMMASETNPSKITNTFIAEKKRKITDDTVRKYLSLMEEAYLFSRIGRYDIEGRRYINASYKFYFEDIGVRNARLNFRQINETHLMENIIFNELRVRGFQVDTGRINMSEKTDRLDANGKTIYSRKKLEVDFVATLGCQKYYIQSAWSAREQEKELQEKRPFFHIGDSFRKILIVQDNIRLQRDENGIVTMNLFDFLMDPGSLER